MDSYSDEEFEDAVSPSSSSHSSPQVASKSELESLQSLLDKARSTFFDLKENLGSMDTTNLETESIPSPVQKEAQNRFALVTPSPRKYDRDSWIKASRGEGQERKWTKEDEVQTSTKAADPAPGLSTHVTVIRKKAPAVSFAPPKHVEKVVPKVPPKKKPITKKGKREERDARIAARREIREHDPALEGKMTAWRRASTDFREPPPGHNNVNLRGTSFAPPPDVDKILPRDRPVREPITKKGKRLAQQAKDGVTPEETLYTVEPIDTAEFTKRPQAAKFGTSKRSCIPQAFSEKPWHKKMEDILALGPGTDLKPEVAQRALQKRVLGGVIATTGRDTKKANEDPPPDPIFVDSDRAFSNLSKFGRTTQDVKIMKPATVKKTTPVYPRGQTPGPGAYIKVGDVSQATEKRVTKHEMRKESAAILRERKAAGVGIGPGYYEVEKAEKIVQANTAGGVVVFSKAGTSEPQAEVKSWPEPMKVDLDASDSSYEIALEDMSSSSEEEEGKWNSSDDDSSVSSDSDSEPSYSSDCSRSSSSFSSRKRRRNRKDNDRNRNHSKKKMKSRQRSVQNAPLTHDSQSTRSDTSYMESRRRRRDRMMGRGAGVDTETETEAAKEESNVKEGQIRKVAYGVFKAFFKKATDIPSGWRQLAVEECSKRKREILDAIGEAEVYHLVNGRIRGTLHGGSVDSGQFDTFGVKKKFTQKQEQQEDNNKDGRRRGDPWNDDSSNSNSSYSYSLANTSVSSAVAKKKQKELDDRDNMGWILLTTTSEVGIGGSQKKSLSGYSFAPKRGAGVTWKNRKILAHRKALTVQEKTIGAGFYDVKFQAVEKNVKGVPAFERAALAKKKEEERQKSNANLAVRRAQDILAEQSRAEYLNTQLPKKWVPESEDDDNVMGISKPVFSYKEPTPLPRQAVEKKKLDEMAEAARQTYLSTQMPKDWTVQQLPPEQQRLYKNIGRDSVVVKEDVDGIMIPKRVAFTEDLSALKSPTGAERGPGKYDPYKAEEFDPEKDMMRESVMALATGRNDAAGPFGERPENAVVAEMEDFGGMEGDRLLLDVAEAQLKLRESVKGGVIGVAGVDDVLDDDGDAAREGDELILDVEGVNRFGKLKVPAAVDFVKMQGRPSSAWEDETRGVEAEDFDVDGDNLILNVPSALSKLDKKIPNIVIGESKRWASPSKGDEGGDALTLSPHLTPVRERAVVGFVRDFSKMPGRDDLNDDSELLFNADPDGSDIMKWIADARAEADRNISEVIQGGKVVGKSRPVTLVDMGKSKTERFNSNADIESSKSEINPNWKVGMTDRNKVLVNMSKENGRPSSENKDYLDDVGVEVEGGGAGGRDGDRLVLGIKDSATRFKGPMVGDSISKQSSRWNSDKNNNNEEGEGPEISTLVNTTRYGAVRQKLIVDMSNQLGRRSDNETCNDDLGVVYGQVSEGGSNLILSPHPSVVLPRKGKGVPVISRSLREKVEYEKIEKGYEERKERRIKIDEKKKRREERREKKRKEDRTKEQIKRDLEYIEKEKVKEVGAMLEGVDLSGL
mmetsp:Transcript_2882/g.5322  ORF Transcript_2882/g.5322 Transcript_2882/m.5322 type:complete len:1532 (+) Transcript_2882:12-4607(+)